MANYPEETVAVRAAIYPYISGRATITLVSIGRFRFKNIIAPAYATQHQCTPSRYEPMGTLIGVEINCL
jgi:hypothetical protein